VLVGTLLASLACALSGCAQAHRRPADPPAGRRLAVERRDATRPLPARVTITPQAAMTPIPRSYLGLSTEYSALPQWSSSMSLLERVLSLVHVTRGGPLVLRVGGDSADRSFWDPDAAPMPRWAFTLGPPWLDQARDLVRRLGIKLILDLNLITDSPATAAQWARAAEARLPHGSIVAFEVGNEPDIYSRADWMAITAGRQLSGRPSFGRPLPATLTARSYAADFRDYAEALEQVAPHTILAGPALANPVVHERWLTTLFAGAGHSLGLVTIHRYPYSACVHARAAATVAHLLSPAASTGMAAALRPDVQAAHDAGLPLRLTELNSVNCGGRPGVSDTFATALWAPDALFALLRAGVDGVNLHVRADAINAPFALTADGLDARPLLYGLILFARALGPQARLVKLTTHHARSVNMSVWGVRVGPNTLHVVMINKSRRSVRVTLRLPATADAGVQRLLAPSAGAQTGVTLGGRALGRDGLWQGDSTHQTVTRSAAGYVVEVRRQSASLISVRVTPGTLGASRTSLGASGTSPTRRSRGRRSLVAGHRVRLVRLLEPVDLLGAERQLLGGEGILQVMELGGPDDRRRHRRPVQQPRQRHLRGWHAALRRHLIGPRHHVEVDLRLVQRVRERVGLRAGGEALPRTRAVAGEHAPGQRAPGDHSNSLVDALGNHLALLLAVDEVVVILHGHEPRAGRACRRLSLGELPRPHAAGADVPRLAERDNVVQGRHRLLDRRQRVEPVDLVEIDVLQS